MQFILLQLRQYADAPPSAQIVSCNKNKNVNKNAYIK